MKWSQCVAELLCLHEIFRKLGYPSEDLFVMASGNGQVQFMMVRHEKKFVVDIMRVKDPHELLDEWKLAATWWNAATTSEDERDAIYRGGKGFAEKEKLLQALAARGVFPLKGPNDEGVPKPN